MKLVDRNVREVTDEEWELGRAGDHFGNDRPEARHGVQISKAKQPGLPVAVGGPVELHTGCTGTGSGGFQDP